MLFYFSNSNADTIMSLPINSGAVKIHAPNKQTIKTTIYSCNLVHCILTTIFTTFFCCSCCYFEKTPHHTHTHPMPSKQTNIKQHTPHKDTTTFKLKNLEKSIFDCSRNIELFCKQRYQKMCFI